MEAANGKGREIERERKKKDRATLEEYKIDRNIKKRKVGDGDDYRREGKLACFGCIVSTGASNSRSPLCGCIRA